MFRNGSCYNVTMLQCYIYVKIFQAAYIISTKDEEVFRKGLQEFGISPRIATM